MGNGENSFSPASPSQERICIAASTSLSSALVASSSTKIGASFKIALASAIRLALTARQLNTLLTQMCFIIQTGLYDLEVARIKSCASACLAASTSSDSLALARPYRILSRAERLKSAVSCVTIPIWRRKLSCVTTRKSCPSIRTAYLFQCHKAEAKAKLRLIYPRLRPPLHQLFRPAAIDSEILSTPPTLRPYAKRILIKIYLACEGTVRHLRIWHIDQIMRW